MLDSSHANSPLQKGCPAMELVPFTHAEPASMRYLDALCETYPAAPSSEFAGQSGMETLRQDMLQN